VRLAENGDRRDPGRAQRRHQRRDHGDQQPNGERGGDRAARHDQRRPGHQFPRTDAGREARARAGETDKRGFGENRDDQLTAGGADRAQERKLAGALRYQHRERVEDQERADEQGHRGEPEQEVVGQAQRAAALGAVGDAHLLTGPDPVTRAEGCGDPLPQHRRGHPGAGADRDRRIGTRRAEHEPLRDRLGERDDLLFAVGVVEHADDRERAPGLQGQDSGPIADVHAGRLGER
jgi:hypothetical protein